MNWKRVVPVLALTCAMGGLARPLFAQAVQTAALTGTVKDSTGAVLPGATVNVSSVTLSWTANNNQLTPPTSYQMQVSTNSNFAGPVSSSIAGSPERRILTSRSRANDWLKPRPITPTRSLSSSPGLRPEPYIGGTKIGFKPWTAPSLMPINNPTR